MNRPHGQQAGRGRARQLFRWLGICFGILIGCAAVTAVATPAQTRQALAQTETSAEDIPVGDHIHVGF